MHGSTVQSVSGVAAIIVVYGAPEARLDACVASLRASQGNDLVEIVLVDNAAATHVGASAKVAARYPGVTVMAMLTNMGFAAGVNRGIAAARADADLILLLNDDATVAPPALSAMTAALRSAGPDVVSVAPKMLLAGRTGVIDAIGNCVNERGEAANVGLGQPDLGQFDEPSESFGPCFGAALFRRSAFSPEAVGPLWERAFLYYEDVEWNWRAQLLGFSSVTVPSAVVHHEMSASSRDDGYDRKHRHIERNLLLCTLRCAEWSQVRSVWTWRVPRLFVRLLRRDLGRASGRAAMGAIWAFPREYRCRRRLQRRRQRPDAEILRFSKGQRTYFDPIRYEPIEPAAAREDALMRLQAARSAGR
jgi:GT2 family glycosyltransferase